MSVDILRNLGDKELDDLYRIVVGDVGSVIEREGFQRPIVLSDLRIVDKSGRLISFIPNEVQGAYLDKLVGEGWREDLSLLNNLRGIRDDILKFRQPGFSTLIIGLMFLDCVNHSNRRSVVAADDEDRARYLMEKIFTFLDHLPSHCLVREKIRNRNEVYLTNGSSFIVGTVGDKNLGIGLTIHNLHCSEIANWYNKSVDARRIFLTALQAVPMDGNCWKETTANGLNEYYEDWQREKAGESTFRPLFFGWNMHKEYVVELKDDEEKELVWTEDELNLKRVYQLTDGQLLWRRMKYGEMGDLFFQHYPLNDSECFLSSESKGVFNRVYLGKLLMNVEKDSLIEWKLEPGERGFGGYIECFKEYEMGKRYAIFCDIAGGISSKGRTDASELDVFCIQNWEQVLHYTSSIVSVHEFARDIDALASYYGGAEVVIERNNHGHAVLEALQYTYQTPNIYVFPEDGQYGFPTNIKTKTLAVSYLAELIEDGFRGEPTLIIHSRRSLEQLFNFVHLPGGKVGGDGTCGDDAVTCLWMAAYYLMDRDYESDYYSFRMEKERFELADTYLPNGSVGVYPTNKSGWIYSRVGDRNRLREGGRIQKECDYLPTSVQLLSSIQREEFIRNISRWKSWRDRPDRLIPPSYLKDGMREQRYMLESPTHIPKGRRRVIEVEVEEEEKKQSLY